MFLLAIYRLISIFIPVAGLVVHLFRSTKEPAYRQRLLERLGSSTANLSQHSIWFHAVSAGEVAASTAVVKSVIQLYPQRRVLITTTTPAGSDAVRQNFGDTVDHCYLPYDAVWCLKRFLNITQPSDLFLIETEIWPNLILQSKKRAVKVYLINARLSQQSAAGYARIKGLTKRVLSQIDGIATQYQDSADRFTQLGVPESKLQVTGNVKFDLHLPPSTEQKSQELEESWSKSKLCWIAASTHEGEEDIALQAHKEVCQSYQDLGLILAPRHPHRAISLIQLAKRFDLSAALLSESIPDTDVLIIDQMGIMLPLYSVANIVFMGGSLQGQGGHNPIEPAALGKPIIMGPDRHNFKEVCRRFEDAGALSQVANARELSQELTALLDSPELQQERGKAALAVVVKNRGAISKLVNQIQEWIDSPATTQQASR